VRVTLTSTTRVIDVHGVPGRVWEGTTEAGVQVFAAITRIAVRADHDLGQFEAELERQPDHTPGPDAFAAFPSRLVL
jgi:hypothetical protein